MVWLRISSRRACSMRSAPRPRTVRPAAARLQCACACSTRCRTTARSSKDQWSDGRAARPLSTARRATTACWSTTDAAADHVGGEHRAGAREQHRAAHPDAQPDRRDGRRAWERLCAVRPRSSSAMPRSTATPAGVDDQPIHQRLQRPMSRHPRADPNLQQASACMECRRAQAAAHGRDSRRDWTNIRSSSDPSVVNVIVPQYLTGLNLSLAQPLLRDFGWRFSLLVVDVAEIARRAGLLRLQRRASPSGRNVERATGRTSWRSRTCASRRRASISPRSCCARTRAASRSARCRAQRARVGGRGRAARGRPGARARPAAHHARQSARADQREAGRQPRRC